MPEYNVNPFWKPTPTTRVVPRLRSTLLTVNLSRPSPATSSKPGLMRLVAETVISEPTKELKSSVPRKKLPKKIELLEVPAEIEPMLMKLAAMWLLPDPEGSVSNRKPEFMLM